MPRVFLESCPIATPHPVTARLHRVGGGGGIVVAVSRFRVVARSPRRTQPQLGRIELVVVVVVAQSPRRTQPQPGRIELVVVGRKWPWIIAPGESRSGSAR